MRRFTTVMTCLLLVACPDPGSGTTDEVGDSVADSTTGGPCMADNDCTPSVCDQSSGDCVECTNNSHCENPSPACVGELCVGCSSDFQCTNPAPICSTESCVPCQTNEECQERGDEVCDQGSCRGCDPNAPTSECPPEYPTCVGGHCSVDCIVDPWDGNEPNALNTIEAGESVVGNVCTTDLEDRFSFSTATAAYIAVEASANPQLGDIHLSLYGPNNQLIKSSKSGQALEVIHTLLDQSGSFELVVEYGSGGLGVPYKLHTRILPRSD